jgi:hypothetical protein
VPCKHFVNFRQQLGMAKMFVPPLDGLHPLNTAPALL